MSATPEATAIAVLQHQQKSTEETLREIQRTVTEGFASMNVKVDRVNELALGMSQLQQRIETQHDGLMRAFANLEDVKRDIKLADADNDKWRVNHGIDIDQRFNHRDTIREEYIKGHAVKHEAISSDMSTARGIAIGVCLLGGLVTSMLWWNVDQWVRQVQIQGEKIEQLQRNSSPKVP